MHVISFFAISGGFWPTEFFTSRRFHGSIFARRCEVTPSWVGTIDMVGMFGMLSFRISVDCGHILIFNQGL